MTNILVNQTSPYRLGPHHRKHFLGEDGRLDSKLFLERVVKIRQKPLPGEMSGRLVPFVFNEEQCTLHANKTGADLVPKARQIGITTYWAGNDLTSAIFNEGERIVFVAHEWSAAHSIKRDMIDVMLRSIPESIRPEVKSNSRLHLEFPWHSLIEVVYASQTKGRSGTITALRNTEAAYYKGSIAGLTEAVPRGCPISTESTGDDPTGMFFEAVRAAKDGESDDALHFFPWIGHEEYRIDAHEEGAEPLGPLDEEEQALVEEHGVDEAQLRWRRWKKRTATMRDEPGRFEREYPVTIDDVFRSAGRPWFDPDILRRMEIRLGKTPQPVRTQKGWLLHEPTAA